MDNNYSSPIIDREIFFGNPKITGAQLSPDGEYLSFIKAYNGVLNIWLKNKSDDFGQAFPLTQDSTRPIRSYFWSRDAKYIIYAQDKGGDENFSLYKVDPSAANKDRIPIATALTPEEGIHSYVASLPRAFPDTIIVAINERDRAWHDFYKISLSSGEKEIILQNDNNFNSVFFDLEGKPRMAGRSLDDGGNEILKLNGRDSERIFYAGLEETISPVKFRKDNKAYFISNLGDSDLTGLYLYDMTGGELDFIESDPLQEADLENLSFSKSSDELIATIYYGDKRRIYWKSEFFKSHFEYLQNQFPEAEISITSTTQSEDEWLVYVATDKDPGSAYYYNTKDQSLTFLYQPRPELPNEHLCSMQAIRYESLDGLEIPAYLSLPNTKTRENLPAVILVHGGPWARDYWGYNSYTQFLTNRGYVVLQVNFRGSTGFGKSFLNAAINQWGEKMQDDLTAGYHYLVNNNIAHKDKVAIVGGSYGGYATLAGLCFTPDIYAAGVSIVGPSNLFTLLETIPPYWESARIMFHKRMGDPTTEEGREQLRRQSPFFHAHKIKAPLLVAQGANDPRVKKSESDQIVIAMRDHKLPVEYINFPDEGHGFARPENSMAFITVMEKFLAKHLGGRMQEKVAPETQTIIDNVTVDISTLEMPVNPSSLSKDIKIFPPILDHVHEGTSSYEVELDLTGQIMNFDVNREIKIDGDVLQIEEKTHGAMEGAYDLSQIYIPEFTAIKRVIKQDPMDMTLRFEAKNLSGEVSLNGQKHSIEKSLESAILMDNGMMDFYLMYSNPNKINESTIALLDAQDQSITYCKIEQKGKEVLNGYATTKIVLTDLESSQIVFTYWISEDHKMIAKESVIRAMNGAKLSMRLKENHH